MNGIREAISVKCARFTGAGANKAIKKTRTAAFATISSWPSYHGSSMQNQALPTAVLLYISQQLNVSLKSLTATIELLDEGSTVPFIARYRKEVTGNLDEVQIRDIEEKLAYFRELEDRRKTVLETIDAQGKLTPELRARIEACWRRPNSKICICRTSRSAAPRHPSRARRAWSRSRSTCGTSVPGDTAARWTYAATFVSADKNVDSVDEALEGRAAHHRRMDQRKRRFPQGGPPDDDGQRHGRQPRHRRRAGPRRQISDVRRVQRAGGEDPVASHARDPARRQRKKC